MAYGFELDKLPQPFALLGVGIPGSGKTTALTKLAADFGIERICPDDIREELSGDASDQSRNTEVWDLAYSRTHGLLERGHSVIFDATHAEPKRRPAAVERFRNYGANAVVAVMFDITLEIALKRNSQRDRVVPEHVLHRMHTSLSSSPPTVAEGFDLVLTDSELFN